MGKISTIKVLLCAFLVVCATLGIFRIEAKAVLLSGDEVRTYANGLFIFSEDIVVEGNATLLIENATIKFVQNASYQYGIKLRNPTNGSPRLIARNSVFQCPRSIKVSLWDNSSAELSGLEFNVSSSSLIELYDSSSLLAIGDCTVNYVELHDFANATFTSSSVYSLSCSDNSVASVSASSLKRVSANDNCSLSLSLSNIESSLSVDDSAEVALEYSNVKNSVVNVRKDSLLSMANSMRFSAVKFNLFDRANVSISGAAIISGAVSVFTCKGNSTLVMSDCLFNGVSFKIHDNSVFKAKSSRLNTATLETYNSTQIELSHSALNWLFSCNDESEASCLNCSFVVLSLDDFSILHLDGCVVELFRGYSQSDIVISNTTIGEVLLELQSINMSFSSLSKGFFAELIIQSGSLSAALSDTTIQSGWDLVLIGSSDLTFHDSDLLNLNVESSKVELWNTTFVNLDTKGSAQVNVWVFLTVVVKDYFGNPVENANVTVLLPDSSMDNSLTDDDGTAVFEVLMRSVNASGDFTNRDCEVGIYYGDSSSQMTIDLEETKLVSSTVPSPWWYLYALWGSIIAAIVVCCLAITWVLRRKSRSKKD